MLIGSVGFQVLNAQTDSIPLKSETINQLTKKLDFEAYGIINYHAFNLQ